MKLIVAAAAAAACVLGAGQAAAKIYNISASDTVGTEVTLNAGVKYQISWAGLADGGLYDAAQVSCGASGCDPLFTNNWSARDSEFNGAFLPGGSTTVEIFSVGPLGTSFATAAASLAAYKAGPISHFGVDINAGAIGSPYLVGFMPSPFVVRLDQTETFHLVVTDALAGPQRYNLGGVSLDITAVPEPESWAFMIIGVACAGSALRRRRVGVAAAA
jgi:hypothetical protein